MLDVEISIRVSSKHQKVSKKSNQSHRRPICASISTPEKQQAE